MGLEVSWVAEVQQAQFGPPGFEGFEKRLEVEFTGSGTLRAISRKNLDRMLELADCTIVAKLSNEELDSYVLSESSLFVCPLKVVIKTCGTTKLLRSIPFLLELAAGLGLSVRSCKYRRGTFFFPAEQAYPHGCFADEVGFLNKYFGNLGSGGGRGFVLGDPSSARRWHVYVASVDEDTSSPPPEPTFTLEVCMTGLNRKVAGKFFRDANPTARGMTEGSGIDRLLPNSRICDFAFDPCGYSMNSVEGGAYSTIHITPEEACSYASFETMGYGPGEIELKSLVGRVAECFKPGFFSVSVYVSGARDGTDAGSWGPGVACPAGYFCTGSFRQELGGGDAVVYHTFELKESNEKWLESSVLPVPLLHAAATEKKLRLVRNPDLLSELKMVQLVSCLS